MVFIFLKVVFILISISSKTFIAISQAIENLFPGESSNTYYSPYKSEQGTDIQISGTLWAHYNYTKDKLRAKNLLEPPRSRAKKNPLVVEPHGKNL